MVRNSEIVTFRLSSSERRAWVVIEGDAEPIVVEMLQSDPNCWLARALLSAGKYRSRFYAGDARQMTYCGPANTNGSKEDGLDAVLLVEIQQQATQPQSPRILLVEDNLATLRAYEKLLLADGYVVHVAEGYQTALEVAKRESVDLAICDINLWDGDGCDLLKDLQNINAIKGIAVTGYTLPEETEHYREAGFGVVLHKPVDHSQIASAISQLMGTDCGTNPATDLPPGEATA